MAEVIVISSESDDEDIDADINPRSFTKVGNRMFSEKTLASYICVYIAFVY